MNSHRGGNDKLSLEMLDKSAMGCRDEGVLKLRVNFERRNGVQVIAFLEVKFYIMTLQMSVTLKVVQNCV